MPEIAPFRACHFKEDLTDRWDNVFTPPYDIIKHTEKEKYLELSPYNVIRLILPSSHHQAHRTLSRWIEQSALVVEENPVLFQIVETFEFMGTIYTRWGLLCTMRLEDFSSGMVVPHEQTIPAHKRDRLELMKAVKGNLSPVFGIFEGDGYSVQDLLRRTTRRLLYRYHDFYSTIRTVFLIDDENTIASLQESLRDRRMLIADGHHRYETALAYRDAYATSPHSPENYVLVYLSPGTQLGLRIFPTHRLVEFNIMGEKLLQRLGDVFDITPSTVPSDDELLKTPPDVFYISMKSGIWRVALKKGARLDYSREVHSALERVNAVIVEHYILEDILGYSNAGQKGLVHYYHTVSETLEHLKVVENGTAFFLSPLSVDDVFSIASQGVRFPPKTTYFHPKVPSGIAFHLFQHQSHYRGADAVA